MKIRLISIVIMLVFAAPLLKAQNTEDGRVSVAVLGGVNFQNLNGKNAFGDKLENDLVVGYHAGLNVQIPLTPEFYFQPGLLFSTKGASSTNELFTSKYTLSYLELPLNFVYKGMLGNGYVLVGFGPYLAYAVDGKVTDEGGSVSLKSDITFKNKVTANDSPTGRYLKAFDAGGNVFVGYEMASGIFLQLNAQLGMIRINPEDKRIPDDKTILKNTGFGVSAGYRF